MKETEETMSFTNACKHFKEWRIAHLLNKDGKIVTVDSGEETSIFFSVNPGTCDSCNQIGTCYDLHVAKLDAETRENPKIWIRKAGKFGIVNTSLFTQIFNLGKMSKAIRQFDLVDGKWKEV